jgi:hypothetical protein
MEIIEISLFPNNEQYINIPIESKILDVKKKGNFLLMYVLCDPVLPHQEIKVIRYMTGEPINPQYAHIKTVHTEWGVYHYFIEEHE